MPTQKPFIKVRDTNRKPIRGLWQRGARYYLQIKERSANSPRRIPLEATTLSEAKLAAEEKRREAREGQLPQRGRKPTFVEVADACLAIAATRRKPRTVKEDAHRLRRLKAALGHMRVDFITTPMIAAWRDKRLLSGVSPRTVNLDLIALRAVFRKCLEDGLIVRNPMAKLVKLAERKPLERKFLRPEQLKGLLDEAQARLPDGRAKYRNGELLADFLKLLAYSGAREQEALRCDGRMSISSASSSRSDRTAMPRTARRGGWTLTICSPGISGTWRPVAIRKPIGFFPARSAVSVTRRPDRSGKPCAWCAQVSGSIVSCHPAPQESVGIRAALGLDFTICDITSLRCV